MPEPRTVRLDQEGLAKVFGELEARIMQAAWSAGAPVSVREVHESVDPGLHYNTVLTVMERLERKGVLTRQKVGRAHVYEPTQSLEDFTRSVTSGVLRDVIADLGDDAIAAFVTALEEVTPDALAQLERFLREHGHAGPSSKSAPPGGSDET